jgi:hypothetical protein
VQRSTALVLHSHFVLAERCNTPCVHYTLLLTPSSLSFSFALVPSCLYCPYCPYCMHSHPAAHECTLLLTHTRFTLCYSHTLVLRKPSTQPPRSSSAHSAPTIPLVTSRSSPRRDTAQVHIEMMRLILLRLCVSVCTVVILSLASYTVHTLFSHHPLPHTLDQSLSHSPTMQSPPPSMATR